MADLATVDDVGAVLGLTLDPTDPTATFALAYASAMIRKFLNQQVDPMVGDVELGTPMSGVMFLREFPVTAVTQVETLDVKSGVWTVQDPSTYRASLRWGTVRPSELFWPNNWPDGDETWRVTYDHGYSPIPADLVGVCASVAARMFNTPVGIDMERIGQRQTKYNLAADTFNALEMLVLVGYSEGRIS